MSVLTETSTTRWRTVAVLAALLLVSLKLDAMGSTASRHTSEGSGNVTSDHVSAPPRPVPIAETTSLLHTAPLVTSAFDDTTATTAAPSPQPAVIVDLSANAVDTRPLDPQSIGGVSPKYEHCGLEWCSSDATRKVIYTVYDPSGSPTDVQPPLTQQAVLEVNRQIAPKIVDHKYRSISESLEQENDVAELHSPPIGYVQCVKRNAAIGYAVSITDRSIQGFISSFQRYHGPCDEAYLVVDDIPDVVVERSKGNVHFIKRKKWLRRGVDKAPEDLALQRVFLIEKWVRAHWTRFHYIVHLDTRDMIFFANMFESLFRHNVTGLFSVAEALTLQTAPINARWIDKYTDSSATSEFIRGLRLNGRLMPVICSGLYGGHAIAMLDYLGVYVAAIHAASPEAARMHAIDQGIHIFLQLVGLPLTHFPHRVSLLDETIGPLRHFYKPQWAIRRDDLGRHLNCHGEPYAAVHQLDRYEWAFQDAKNDYLLHGATRVDGDCPDIERDPVVPINRRSSAAPLVPLPHDLATGLSRALRVDHNTTAPTVTTVPSRNGLPAGSGPAPPRWAVSVDHGRAAVATQRSSQHNVTVCASHNAVLLYAHAVDVGVLQPLIAAIQKHHTICDVIVVFIPQQQTGLPVVTFSEATGVAFEVYQPVLTKTEEGHTQQSPSRAVPDRRHALSLITRWLRHRASAYTQVIVFEDVVRQRVAVFENLFAPFYERSEWSGRVWFLPWTATPTAQSTTERHTRAAALATVLDTPTVRACFGASGSSLHDAIIATAQNTSVFSGIFGGATEAVVGYLEATEAAIRALDRRRADPAVAAGPNSAPCSAYPHVLEVLRAHVVPRLIAAPSSEFPFEVVRLSDRFGPHRHFSGTENIVRESTDRHQRFLRCDRHRTPFALFVGLGDTGTGSHVYAAYLSQYRRRKALSNDWAHFATFLSSYDCQ
jgi:hypothetical protein